MRAAGAALLVALFACQRAPSIAAAAPSTAVAPAPKPAAAGAREAAGAARPQVHIDDGVVERFVAFDKRYLAGLPARMKAMSEEMKALDAGKAQGVAGVRAAQAATQAMLQRMDADDERLRAENGVTREEVQALQEIAMGLAALRGADPERKDEGIARLSQRFGKEQVAAAKKRCEELTELWDQQMAAFQKALALMKR